MRRSETRDEFPEDLQDEFPEDLQIEGEPSGWLVVFSPTILPQRFAGPWPEVISAIAASQAPLGGAVNDWSVLKITGQVKNPLYREGCGDPYLFRVKLVRAWAGRDRWLSAAEWAAGFPYGPPELLVGLSGVARFGTLEEAERYARAGAAMEMALAEAL